MTNDRFTEDQKAWLSAKLDRSHVVQRTHAGRSLSYIEAWHAIAEANRIFGFDGWHRETVDMRLVDQVETKTRAGRDAWRVAYIAKVRVEVLSVRREGTGFGQGIDADLGLAHESAVKEAESDAMKRALMTFGNPFGLALYDKAQADVEEAKPARRRPPAGIQTPMPQGALIEPIMPANAPAGTAGEQERKRGALGGPRPSLLQRATAEADKGSFAYEHFWTQELNAEERLDIGVEMHLKLKDAAMVADRAAEGAAHV